MTAVKVPNLIVRSMFCKLFDILCYIENENKHMLEWKIDSNKKFINACLPGGIINIINYLSKDYNTFGNRTFNTTVIRNDQPFNFRNNNLMLKNKTSTKKFKIKDSQTKFFSEQNLTVSIIQNYSGHIKEFGQTAEIERNRYRLLSIQNTDTNINPFRCYEVFLDKKNADGNEYSFIIDENDISILSNIQVKNLFYNNQDNNTQFRENNDNIEEENNLTLENNNSKTYSNTVKYDENIIKQQYITITNPTWHLYMHQYIALSYVNIYKNIRKEQILYLHRYLMKSQITNDKNTVDHINGNKFDNRRCNLKATNMTEQNMNRDMVKRHQNLNTILNNYNRIDIDIPINLSFTSIQFISYLTEKCKNKNTITEREYFTIEISKARTTSSKDINDSTTKAIIIKDNHQLSLKIKLSQAVCIRYFHIQNNPKVLLFQIVNKKFNTITEFLNYTESLINTIMGQAYTIDTFLDYMLSLKLPKYTDPRKSIISSSSLSNANIEDVSTIKFDFFNYVSARNKFDISIIIGKDTNSKHIKYINSGCGGDNLSIEDKKAFALVIRYNTFVEIENDLNKKIHHTVPLNNNINLNTTGLKSLSDFTLEGKTMKTFIDLRTHTEKYINKLLNHPHQYTLETFAEFITKKANHKKIKLEIAKLAYDYPPLVKQN